MLTLIPVELIGCYYGHSGSLINRVGGSC